MLFYFIFLQGMGPGDALSSVCAPNELSPASGRWSPGQCFFATCGGTCDGMKGEVKMAAPR